MAKPIMVVGTMSNVGKSFFTAALCRIFKQDGYKTAPFKSQNMSLNSFITKEGLEMGRAQVMQAEAAYIEPSVTMNPILLKPTTDMGSQVIICGEVIGNMSAIEYYKNKKKFVPKIKECYNHLNENYDIIVIEGAGSPAEINLKDNDIVNMGLAKMINAPVLLVGDIDRGGVFAQLIGTIILLEETEKILIKGMIINKFRGDKSILQSGIKMLEKLASKKVLGVVPYVNCDIDDEDSLSYRFSKKDINGIVDIAVIKLPKISNFTDFNVFEHFEGVSIRYVKSVKEFGEPDMIIIPGTKNTIQDLLWLRECGIENCIKKCYSIGKIIFGICGGFQMLGKEILDPNNIEYGKNIKGINLLPINTIFKENKTRAKVKGCFKNISGILNRINGIEFEGYEIHMGVSEILDGSQNMNIIYDYSDKNAFKYDGLSKGNVYGTYVHGIFDFGNIAKLIISAIIELKGIELSHVNDFNINKYKETQYDILADTVRNSVDIDAIYKIIDNGV